MGTSKERILKTLFAAVAATAVSVPTMAHALAVYPGCAIPNLKPSHHTFYVDPVHGSMSGDGSAAKPWHTLAEVLDTSKKLLSTMGHNSRTFGKGDDSLSAINPTGPIKAGDLVLLKSGNHGDVRLTNEFNSDFITVMPAPGQTPILSSLTVVSSGKWLFQGLKVLGAHPNPTGISATVSIGRGDFIGATSDIIFDSGSVSASDDTSGWTAKDWSTKTDSYTILLAQRATCMAATNNHLYNGGDGIALEGSRVLAQGNSISAMYNDGIDFYGSNQTIRLNTISGGTNMFSSETLHPDGIQGWSLTTNGVQATNVNVVVDSNTVIKTGVAETSQMQGITVFDGLWDGLQITNNVVVSNVYHGISIYGGKNVSIINNTVLASDPSYSTWIIAAKSKTNQPGQNIVIRNNITSNLVINYPSVTYDHNVIASGIQTRDASNRLATYKTGTIGTANIIAPAILNQFTTTNANAAAYNLRLKSGSVAIGAGDKTSAPSIDITGKKRSVPIDCGAYQH